MILFCIQKSPHTSKFEHQSDYLHSTDKFLVVCEMRIRILIHFHVTEKKKYTCWVIQSADLLRIALTELTEHSSLGVRSTTQRSDIVKTF